MTPRRDEIGVVVLDIRDGVSGVADVEGAVVVLDHAETAAEHDHVYQTLLGSPQVSGVICLAVDGGGPEGAVGVRPPPSLGPAERGSEAAAEKELFLRGFEPSRVLEPLVAILAMAGMIEGEQASRVGT